MTFGGDIERGYRERSKENVMRDKAWQAAFSSPDEEFEEIASKAGLTEEEKGTLIKGRIEMASDTSRSSDGEASRLRAVSALSEQHKEEKSGGLGAAKDLEGKGYLNVNATLEKMESYKPGLGKIEGYFRGMRNEKS